VRREKGIWKKSYMAIVMVLLAFLGSGEGGGSSNEMGFIVSSVR
jgi:hypothetical protein